MAGNVSLATETDRCFRAKRRSQLHLYDGFLCFDTQTITERFYFVAMKVFTTMAFGCTPTGIRVSKEYSLGSSLRGLRF